MGRCPVHFPMFLGIPGLYPLHASGTLPPSPNCKAKAVCRHYRVSPGGQNCGLRRSTGLGLSWVGESGCHRQRSLTSLLLSLALLYPESRDSPALGLVCGFGQWGMRKRAEEGRSVGLGFLFPHSFLAGCHGLPPGSCPCFTLSPTRPGVTTAPSPLSL